MKKIIYAVLATISGLVLLFSYRTSRGDSVTESVAVDPASVSGSSSSGSSIGSGSSGSGSSSGSSTAASGLTDGSYTGQAVDTRWGPVQVAITVSGGTITAVDVPEYPNGNRRDQEINQRALPQLVSETISAQSANIDMVSGATYTSQGYLQSLQSAIDQATS
ncbi:FMN-binding protein [Microbacterium pumilum]|uniref:FMN-binding protein n=1 Tax=Microbacterium pumilum TaxID=344165 RepID=A0ABN2T014_9MICO